jgi:hypothetical protein
MMDRAKIIIAMQARMIKDLHAEIVELQARIHALTAEPRKPRTEIAALQARMRACSAEPRKAPDATAKRHAPALEALHRLMAECSVAPILLAATRMRVSLYCARSIIKKQPEYKLVLINRRSYVARR